MFKTNFIVNHKNNIYKMLSVLLLFCIIFTCTITTFASTQWPLSGFEPIYDSYKWNTDKHVYKSTNCYAYALDLTVNPITNEPLLTRAEARKKRTIGKDKSARFALQPGSLYGQKLNSDFSNIIELCTYDAKVANRIFMPIGKFENCPKGTSKIAIFTSTFKNTKGAIVARDYHLYRQNTSGTWSHKPGNTPTTNLDASRHIITDPELADRSIPKSGGLSYNNFIGYFAVGPNAK